MLGVRKEENFHRNVSKANLLRCVAMNLPKALRDPLHTRGTKRERMPISTEVICGDCCKILQRFGDNSFDLIVTSPPYADQRTKTYGGIKPCEYLRWFLARSEQFHRVLKPTGTFVLNIKEKAEN